MNKTISINLGGFFFHIDEDAFNKLNKYLDAVKKSLSPDVRDEIIKDIESRIAELFQEKIKNEKQVISNIEVDEVIVIMGQPEDYKIDNEPIENEYNSNQSYYTNKKLYRDIDNKVLGGVCAGIGHYFSVDAVWIKVLFIILTFSGGFGIPIYLILWILLPEAITTTQKLEMRGMPINISNIERKVREGIDEITSKIGDLDTNKMVNNVKSGSQKLGSTLEEIISTIFKVFGKIIGGFIVFVSSIMLIALLVGTILMLFSNQIEGGQLPWNEYLRASNYTDFPMWILYLFSFFAAAIPLFFVLILGLKLLITNLKSIGNYAKFSLLGLWIIAICFLIYFGIHQASQVSKESKVVEQKEIIMAQKDTLQIKMLFNNFYTKSVSHKSDFKFTVDTNDKEIIYSNNVKIHFMKTDENKPFIQIEKAANGKTYEDAKNRAKNIIYKYDIQENIINLDNYFVTDRNNKYRDQEVHIYLYLPNSTIIYADESIANYITSQNSDGYIEYDKENNHYQFINGNFTCLDCPIENNNNWDSNTQVEVKINGKEIISSKTEVNTVKIDSNGIRIETKK